MTRDFNLDEIIDPDNIDLSSFKLKDHLNPRFWDKKDGSYVLKKKLRDHFLLLADDFFDSLEIDFMDIEDIILTGSIANYNWSNYSDVDIHIKIDFSNIDIDKELLSDYFSAKKSRWGDSHDVKIYGLDVEITVKDTNEIENSTGIYSLINNKWVLTPSKDVKISNIGDIKEKSAYYMDMIDSLYKYFNKNQYMFVYNKTDKIKNKIKKMRQGGLEEGGEYSVENLVFKVLRRTGYIEKLYDLENLAYDKLYSLK